MRVQPGASRASVGGRFGDADPPVLVVRTTARAVEGAANAAVRAAIAAAFGVRPNAVTMLTGERNRVKVLDVQGASSERLTELLGQA